jgi:hypothetical protein
MATKIYINTDLKDLTANAVANKNRPTQVVRLPQIVEGETLDVELSLVNSGGGYDTRSGDATVTLAVAVSARGAAATSGTFTLTASTETTSPLAWNASAEAVEGALNALNSGSGAYGSKVDVKKLNSGSYRIIFKDVGARTDFGGTSIDLAPESEVTISTAVVGSATIRAQMIIEISQQPAIYTNTWTTGSSKFSGQLNANTARVQELIATGQDAFFEVKVDNDVVCQVPIAVLPAVAALNSLPAHTLPSNLCDFAADPSTNGCFSVTNWLVDLLAPHTKAVWGSITGTLSDQTDLKVALDAKAPIANPVFTGPITQIDNTNATLHLGDEFGTKLKTSNAGFQIIDVNSSNAVRINIPNSMAPGYGIFMDSGAGTFDISANEGTNIGAGDLHVCKFTGVDTTSKLGIRTKTPDAALDVDGDVKFSDFTSTSRSTDVTALNPIQNYQPATDDTLANLCVDTAGNVVRGSQEATWTFDSTQLNALTSTRINLLNSPGAGKCVVVEETNWLIEVDLTKAYQATNVKLACEMLGVNANSVATQITAANMNQIAQILKAANTNSFGLYHRDVPDLARIYRFDVPMTIRATNGAGATNVFPDNFVSVKLKIKYRVFDSTTF